MESSASLPVACARKQVYLGDAVCVTFCILTVALETGITECASEVEQWYVRHNYFTVLYHKLHVSIYIQVIFRPSFTGKGKAVLLQAWSGPKGSSKLR